MSIESAIAVHVPRARALDDPRARRILCFVIGVTLASAYATYFNWSYNHLMVMFAINFLTMPMRSAPSLRFAVSTVVKMIASVGLGLVLMLLLHSFQLFGFALVALLLFLAFYLQAQGRIGGSDVMCVIIGCTIVPAFGSTSMDTGVLMAKGISKNILAVFPLVWIAFAVVPGGVLPRLPKEPRVEGTSADRGILALRSVVVLLPWFVFMLSSDNNTRYLIGYMKAAIISQVAVRMTARKFAGDLFMATLIGCTAGVIMWWLMKLWPSWLWFLLLMALFSLVFATRIFSASGGLQPNALRWSYGLTTLVLILFPAAMSQGFTGDDVDMKFYQRILDFSFVIAYTIFAVLLYHAVVATLRRAFGKPAAENPTPEQHESNAS
jgi:hypothetical protein